MVKIIGKKMYLVGNNKVDKEKCYEKTNPCAWGFKDCKHPIHNPKPDKKCECFLVDNNKLYMCNPKPDREEWCVHNKTITGIYERCFICNPKPDTRQDWVRKLCDIVVKNADDGFVLTVKIRLLICLLLLDQRKTFEEMIKEMKVPQREYKKTMVPERYIASNKTIDQILEKLKRLK